MTTATTTTGTTTTLTSVTSLTSTTRTGTTMTSTRFTIKLPFPMGELTGNVAVGEEILEALARESASDSSMPRMVVQAHLAEPVFTNGEAVFAFDAPLDGCYVIEESHPHVEGASAVPL